MSTDDSEQEVTEMQETKTAPTNEGAGVNQAVLVDVRDHVATITLNRPDAMNAINADLSAGLMDALRRVRGDDDIRVMAAGARVTTGYARRGLNPDGGMSYQLPRLVGVARALELVLTARDITAEEAHRLGLVAVVFPDDTFREDCPSLRRPPRRQRADRHDQQQAPAGGVLRQPAGNPAAP